MEQNLVALGGILLKAIPTVILLLILHAYLKAVLFRPLEKMWKERDALTKGARSAADDSLATAERKAAEYEAKLRDARAAVYKEQEDTRKRWLDAQAAQVASARSQSEQTVKEAKEAIASEAAQARQQLEQASSGMADQIANALLAGRSM